MTLQFDPGAYGQILQQKQQQKMDALKMVTDSLNQIPSDLMSYQQNQRENQHQNLMNKLLQQQINSAQTQNSPLVSPSSSGPSDTGMFGNKLNLPPTSGSVPLPGESNASQFTAQPYSGTGNPRSSFFPSAPPMGADSFALPYKNLGQGGGGGINSVGTYNPPDNTPAPMPMFAMPTQKPDPEAPYLKILQDPTESPIRQKMAAEALDRITTEEKTPFERQGWQLGIDSTKSTIAKNLADAEKARAEATFMGSTGGKQGQMNLKLQDNYNTENKDTLAELRSAQSADGLIEAAKTNPVAYNSVPLKLAKMLTGSSRININEIKAMGGSNAILAKAQQAGQQMATGTITIDNYQFMKGMVKVLIDSNKNELRNAGMRKAMQLSQINKLDPKANYQTIVGEPYGQETFGAANIGSSDQLIWQGRPIKDTPANRAWLQQQQGTTP